MRNILVSAIFVFGLLISGGAGHTQTALNTVTATCKDGTAFSGTTRSGACRGHGGVQSWGTAAAVTAPATSPKNLANTSSGGGEAGQVWVNTATKVYHCPGTRWYGKTKQGAYMSEAQARAEGDRPDHGKTCKS